MEKPAPRLPFEKLARSLSPQLLRYLRRMVGDQALAEDLLQETLIRMDRGFDAFAGRARVKTWAFAIATHVAADYFRKPERKMHIVEMSEMDDLPGSDRSLDERVVMDEMNACVRQVIDSLPDDYRAALVLHDLECLTAERTAQICNCSVATARIRIHRARNRLQKALEHQCQFYRDEDSVLRCERKP